MNIKKLENLRESNDIKKTDLADILGLQRGSYGKYESGERQPSHDTLKKIANHFGVTTDYLLDNEDFEYKKNIPLSKDVQVIVDALNNVDRPTKLKIINTIKTAFPDAFKSYPVGYKPGVGFVEEDGARAYFNENILYTAASDGSEISDDIIIQLANDLYNENN